MSKPVKGILGVKKHPKNQLLFSFQVRKGEEWASDEQDSDYMPSGDEGPSSGKKTLKLKIVKTKKKPKKSRKRHLAKDHQDTRKRRKKKAKIQDVVDLESASPEERLLGQKWCEKIPPEILFRIFQYVVAADGALPFLARSYRISSLWYETACDPRLWQNVDLSYGWIAANETTLHWLCVNRLSMVKQLNLSSWKNLTNAGLQCVAINCPLLEGINLSYCTKISHQGINAIIENCPNMKSWDLSFLSKDAVPHQLLNQLIEKKGEFLESLNLSGNKLKNFNALINVIASTCQNLQILELCNTIFSADFMPFNIEKLQHSFPALRILRLANSKFAIPPASTSEQIDSPGFPKLEELSLAANNSNGNISLGLSNSSIHRLLKRSEKLRLLDLRGCTQLSCEGLKSLPIRGLQQLYLSQSTLPKHGGLVSLAQKWQHSIQEFDVSWCSIPEDSLASALDQLASRPDLSQLTDLHLSGTSVEASSIKVILTGCPHLGTLNLGSCRGLPRGMKRDYTGDSLEKLKSQISDLTDGENG